MRSTRSVHKSAEMLKWQDSVGKPKKRK